MKSVLGMRPGLRRDLRFYVAFSERHKFIGTRSGEQAFSAEELIYLDADQPLEAGMDFGNMLSMVIGQLQGSTFRILKNLHELPPGWMRQLADQFLEFFASHRRKELQLWFDRAGNNYQRQGQDQATQIKYAIEHDAEGRRTGWIVTLNSRRQSTIAQQDEYNFMQQLMGEQVKGLPRLLIDTANCRELVSSMERAQADIRYIGQQKTVKKIKKSEKLPPRKLPMLSTNYSDAFKYLMMRREWVKLAQRKDNPTTNAAVDLFMEQR